MLGTFGLAVPRRAHPGASERPYLLDPEEEFGGEMPCGDEDYNLSYISLLLPRTSLAK